MFVAGALSNSVRLARALYRRRANRENAVIVTLSGLIAAGTVAVLTNSRAVLWMAGVVIGFFAGSIQASSRSLMARLSPLNRGSAFFGIFALSGRATDFAGPATVATVTGIMNSQRPGIAAVVAFCLSGAGLLRMREATPSARRRVRGV